MICLVYIGVFKLTSLLIMKETSLTSLLIMKETSFVSEKGVIISIPSY